MNVEWINTLKDISGLIVWLVKTGKSIFGRIWIWNRKECGETVGDIQNKLSTLQTEINLYGEKINSYRELHIYIDRMSNALKEIRIEDTQKREDSDFWKGCSGWHGEYHQGYGTYFVPFNSDILNPEHKARIETIKESLGENWGVMHKTFRLDRKIYMEAVFDSARHCRTLMGFTYIILQEISDNLKQCRLAVDKGGQNGY